MVYSCWIGCCEALHALRVVFDPYEVCAGRACIAADRCDTIRGTDADIDLRAIRSVGETAGCLAKEVAGEVAGRDRLIDRERVVPGHRGHFTQ